MKRDQVEEAHTLLNSVFDGIKFTIEVENQGQLPFLDILIKRTRSGNLQTSMYRKATNTDQLLNFHSNHPMAQKKSCVRTLFRRIETHCSTKRAKTTERLRLHQLFQTNGYPPKFVTTSLRQRPPFMNANTDDKPERHYPRSRTSQK